MNAACFGSGDRFPTSPLIPLLHLLLIRPSPFRAVPPLFPPGPLLFSSAASCTPLSFLPLSLFLVGLISFSFLAFSSPLFFCRCSSHGIPIRDLTPAHPFPSLFPLFLFEIYRIDPPPEAIGDSLFNSFLRFFTSFQAVPPSESNTRPSGFTCLFSPRLTGVRLPSVASCC